MSRLPIQGGDNGNWGNILNDFLVQSHNTSGSLRDGVVGPGQIQDSAVSANKLSAPVNSILASAQTAVQTVNGKSGTSVSIGLDDVSDVNLANAADGQALVKNGTSWTPTAVASASDLAGKADQVLYNVRSYGASADGVADDTAAIAAALNAAELAGGGIVYFPTGVYKWTSTIFLDKVGGDFTYRLKGDGRNSKIVLTNFPDDNTFALRLNESSLNTPANNGYTTHPRCVVEDLHITGGDGSTSFGSWMFCNLHSAEHIRCIFRQLGWGVKTTGYVDSMIFRSCYGVKGVRQWLYEQGGNGDSFIADGCFFDPAAKGFKLYRNAGATLGSLNGGIHQFSQCFAIEIIGGHMENGTENTGFYPQFKISGSQVAFRGVFFRSHSSGPDIEIDDDPTIYRQKSDVLIDSCKFAARLDDPGSTWGSVRPTSVLLTNFLSFSRLRFRDSFGLAFGQSSTLPGGLRWTFEPTGFNIAGNTTNDSALSNLVASITGKVAVLGNVELRRRSGTWEFATPAPESGMRQVRRHGNVPALSYLGKDSTTFKSTLSTGTYYYRVGVKTQDGYNTTAALEQSIGITTGESPQLVVGVSHGPCLVRVWRGTTTGSYDRYIEIPVAMEGIEIFDQGDTIAGVTWATTGIPGIPSSNETFDGIITAGTQGRKTMFNSAAPTSGSFIQGDRVNNINAAVGAPTGWVCTVSGSPGTWVAQPNL